MSTDLDRINAMARHAAKMQALQQCQAHTAKVQELSPYPVQAISSDEPWSGRHRSALVHSPDGQMVLDNGALGYGTAPLPASVLAKMKKPYVIRQLGPDGQPMHVWPWEDVPKSVLETVVDMPEAMEQWRAKTAFGE